MIRPMLLIKTLKHIFLFSAIILIGCTPPLDYFGNNPDMEKDRIFQDNKEKTSFIIECVSHSEYMTGSAYLARLPGQHIHI